ncbi:uncharacterized protein [Linepithema humile]|uniref:uncharacterized protein isoform X2 n=1 Tax=Linepithema humile TaxID=83485 RepID=UPI00351E5CBF
MSFLYSLPNELLIVIFKFCDVYTLSQISMVCKQFCRVSYMILNEKANHLLVTNQMSEKFCERCKLLLSSYDSKFITNYNWKHGIYEENEICKLINTNPHFNKNLLQMTKNMICLFDKNCLLAYNRDNFKEKAVEICNSDIIAITYCNDVILTSHRDGSIRLRRIQLQGENTNYFTQLKIHCNVFDGIINHIDATSQHIILSCRLSNTDASIEIQKNMYEKDGCVERNQIFYRKKCLVSSVSFDPTGIKFAANTSDLEHPRLTSFRIYDIDKRTSKCVHMCDTSSIPEWSDILTCFSSDYLYTIMTGTRNGKIILWDQRKSAPIQTYQISPIRKSDSFFFNEIRSIQFDSTYLYAVTKDKLIEFDFKGSYFEDYFEDYSIKRLKHKKIKNFFVNFLNNIFQKN